MEEQLVSIFKSLSDPTRLEILKQLLKHKEMCCQDLQDKFDLSQPTLSHHFNKLVAARVLNERKEGTWRYYTINKKHLDTLGINLKKVLEK